MKLSVVVSTLNDREQLLPCLDALDAHVPAETEVVVVNGPSSDGTTGAVMDRDDVDVLVEISERNPNVSRNAGIGAASGDVVAFLGDEYVVEPAWYEAISVAVASGADIVTGPVVGGLPETPGPDVDPTESKTVAGRAITPFDGNNVAFDRSVLEELDGFDEYLCAGGARDCAHRVAGMGFDVTWSAEMAARCEVETDGGRPDTDWGDTYRSLAYRLAKNYGLRPSVVGRTAGSAVRDGYRSARAVASGEGTPTGWFGNGTTVFTSAVGGLKDGVRARFDDRSDRRNPNGLSTRHDRAVQVYDRRDE
ncbi:glycosyltransferase family 2 protein [Halobacteria archaeon AArc-m2/3/4]|uniref:Glycosyltransferase family 2 protein n=1 Tax=Natronoglomus mannanivorans TaxID=2979990 RepID=A0ABT2QJP7_9EURY|nr:glycosyltransferase family 2 protein [Halobacteria archaeon AArc-m2/3/4]